MPDIRYIDKDFVRFKFQGSGGQEEQGILAFGDQVEVLEEGGPGKPSRVRALELFEGTLEGTVAGSPFRGREKGVLRFSMVDVQQGDGMIIESPPDENDERRIVFIDGGDNKLFARHVAARFRHKQTSKEKPLEVDLVLVTHGDADHFEGLTEIEKSETEKNLSDRKRLFIHPRRFYHNGIVKGPAKDPVTKADIEETRQLGRTVTVDGKPMIVALFDDPRQAPAAEQNSKFQRWFKTLDHWEEGREQTVCRRVAHGMNANQLFGFLHPIKIEIQGPFTSEVTDDADGQKKPALPFFHKPKKSALIHLEEGTDDESASFSVSHTINGHSVAFRLTFGNVRFNFTGDLNQESMSLMRRNLKFQDLEAEILKAPHHGSAEFDFKALQAMRPVVSIISSGDESPGKEFIHPRATLLSALGKISRGETGLIFCTELAAFFAMRDVSHQRARIAEFYKKEGVDPVTRADLHKFYNVLPRAAADEEALPSYFGFERTNFGIIHIRTDGERVLVFTHSGKEGMREAYRFNVDASHKVTFAKDVVTG